jgi:hypothetical protein
MQEIKNTAMQELIDWCIENAFNVESQAGEKYVAIDYEEMKEKFDVLLELERKQITDAVKHGFKDANCINSDLSFDEYFDNNYSTKNANK